MQRNSLLLGLRRVAQGGSFRLDHRLAIFTCSCLKSEQHFRNELPLTSYIVTSKRLAG